MRNSLVLALSLPLLTWVGCGSSGSASPTDGPGGGTTDGGKDQGGTTPRTDAATTTSDAGTGSAGNPNGSCSAGVPAKGQPADTSSPTTVVGTGSASSCSFSMLEAAVTKGGVITFNCGSAPVTIPVTATPNLPTNKNTVIDGGNKVTLDGGNAVQILSFIGPDFQMNNNTLTLQHLSLINGKQTPTQAIPTAPLPCSQGWDDGEG